MPQQQAFNRSMGSPCLPGRPEGVDEYNNLLHALRRRQRAAGWLQSRVRQDAQIKLAHGLDRTSVHIDLDPEADAQAILSVFMLSGCGKTPHAQLARNIP
jgi:hypothetical protein